MFSRMDGKFVKSQYVSNRSKLSFSSWTVSEVALVALWLKLFLDALIDGDAWSDSLEEVAVISSACCRASPSELSRTRSSLHVHNGPPQPLLTPVIQIINLYFEI